MNIDNFIMVKDEFAPLDFCEKAVSHFDKMMAAGTAHSRQQLNDGDSIYKSDFAVEMISSASLESVVTLEFWYGFSNLFWNNAYREYAEKYAILKTASDHKVLGIKIQRTMPGEGYHVWHFESGDIQTSNQLLAFILYLNDVYEGGETEFLYCPRRVAPKTGRLLLFPAAFTHTHRGNQPLSGAKYVMTGWIGF